VVNQADKGKLNVMSVANVEFSNGMNEKDVRLSTLEDSV